jgi:hypothetical protein
MSHTKTARNARIVRLRDSGLSWRKIADRIAVEFPDDACGKTRVEQIYNRDVKGVEDPGTLFRRRQREKASS